MSRPIVRRTPLSRRDLLATLGGAALALPSLRLFEGKGWAAAAPGYAKKSTSSPVGMGQRLSTIR